MPLVPEVYIREFEPLLQANTTAEFPQIKRFLEKEYNKKLEDIYEYFEPIPIGSASLAQVHKAILKDGTKVAVKVQHSYIHKQVKGDIIMVKIACFIAEKIFPTFKYKVR